jgi:DNA polymerase III subunit alpha
MLLNCHTHYSFCYGIFSVDELFDRVINAGYSSFVLTDINNTSACIDNIRVAKQRGLKPIVGIDFRNGTQQQYVGIARNNNGFQELNIHLSNHLHSKQALDIIAPNFNNCYIIYPLEQYSGFTLREHEFVGVNINDLPSLAFIPANRKTSKLVILQTASFANKQQFNAHRLLRAIDTNSLLSKLPKTQQANGNEMLLPLTTLKDAFKHYPAIISQTEAIINDCSIDFEFGKLSNKNLKFYTDSHANDIDLLRKECMNGLTYRYPNPSKEVLTRIEKEIDIVSQLNFASYFLINWDIVNYAQHKNYFYVGRGSGANSILAYLLRITNVDPIELDLYFERFINLYRNNAPDFDMDFSWTDRDDITRYMFNRYGSERTALLGAYNTFQHDAVIRELGKVFGLPPNEIDNLQRVEHIHQTDEIGQLVLRYSQLIKGFPSHLSIHSSGIIISEKPITTYTATNMPPKGYPTTQFSMLEAEDIGLYKFDILSQRGLGKIKDAVQIIKQNKGIDIDIHDVTKFKQDEEIKNLLRKGKTIGCFYVESPAMRMLLTKLRADDYLRLVAASSIIRPGVSKSGMMREYILRYRHVHLREQAKQALPEMYHLLEETYGVMVYQEDVIKIAYEFAGLSLAEADYLRRGMSWKFKQRNEFDKVKNNFFENCKKKGYTEKTINDIWLQIESFANYAFSKGHSASYAVESYQALYLKAYFPLEYMVATLNNGGGFYKTELYVHEARMAGATIKAPCINRGNAETVIDGKIIYLGFNMIAELQHETIQNILRERNESGKFTTLYDFINRVKISIEQMRLLVRANAFAFTQKNKKELLWEIHTLLRPIHKKIQLQELFAAEQPTWQLPELTSTPIDEAYDETELFGFTLNSPFELLQDELRTKLCASDLKLNLNNEVFIVGYLISVKYTRTSKGDRMYFGTFIDLQGEWIDTVHFPPSAKAFPFQGPGCYELIGKVVEEFDFITLEVSAMKRLRNVELG